MLVDTSVNALVKKILGKEFIPRLAKYLLIFPHYLSCCGSNLSGPPAEPFGKDFIALITRLAGITKPSGREAGGGEVMGVWIEGQKKYCH